MTTSNLVQGVAAGVPFVALPPATEAPAPLVVTWHLMEPPASEAAMAEAVPMHGLAAWRVYFGLPMSGARLPEGGHEEFYRRAGEDYVLQVMEPVTGQAAAEFPAAVAELRQRFAIADGPIGVAGGSAGSTVALEVLARAEVPIAAAAVVSPVVQLAPAVGRNERFYGSAYPWTDRSRAVADHYDYVNRARELKAELLLVVGEADDVAFREPSAALAGVLGERSKLVTVPGMGHSLTEADEHAAAVDAEFTAWFSDRLRG
ncbi:alpha/beta hydrolase family protein [Amycolatopsis magusensis]|uniref:alpha/beta hydrolase family protein n=1 Tax=Amycolatopsis magusensis TaxID=882444 RepID=UPI0024A7DF00|nr:prolyl oligopeptidase family serine peptidase [Amycolatopsis magusensis]MDI5974652.1 prolyl oligopeptidase family serine peptidase [Amycolatopsis magusensis]